MGLLPLLKNLFGLKNEFLPSVLVLTTKPNFSRCIIAVPTCCGVSSNNNLCFSTFFTLEHHHKTSKLTWSKPEFSNVKKKRFFRQVGLLSSFLPFSPLFCFIIARIPLRIKLQYYYRILLYICEFYVTKAFTKFYYIIYFYYLYIILLLYNKFIFYSNFII